MSFENRIEELGLALPETSAPVANYVPCVVTGNLLFTAGQIPRRDGELVHRGVVGRDLTVEDAKEAARLCCLSGLAVARSYLGSLDEIEKVVKVTGWVRSAPGFTDQPQVVNGASDLLVEVFGDKGRHARAAVGVNELPLGVSVEAEFVFELKASASGEG